MYQEFAGVYDRMMSEIPYDKWFERLDKLIAGRFGRRCFVCELGCGTGEMTGRFSDAGYEVAGIDISPDMLALAADKKKKGQNILYLNQDMTDFSLHKPADVVLCICDSINYLLKEQELYETFRCVRENLAEGGLFVFDMKTSYCYEKVLGNTVRVEDADDYTVIWENTYDPEPGINEYALTIFVRHEDGGYERTDECHCQRAYGQAVVEELLARAGLRLCGVYGADLQRQPGAEDERIYYVAEPMEATPQQVVY